MLFNKDLFIQEMEIWFRKRKLRFVGQEGLMEVLTFIEADEDWKDGRHLACFLANTGHETGFKYKPIQEIRARAGTPLRKTQDKYWFTGFFGRGLIQLTWLRNYELFQKRLNIQGLVKTPDLALEHINSYEIAAVGMREGLFTGKKLSDYINQSKCDYYNARRIVNGIDRAADIQTYCLFFEKLVDKCLVDEKDNPIKDVSLDSISSELSSTPIGSKPEDPAIKIEAVAENRVGGIKSWWATISGAIGGLGISGSSIWSVLSGLVQNEKYTGFLLNIGIIALIFTGLVLITYLILRAVGKARETKMAHELTLKQMEIRANPNLYNVEVVKHGE